MQGSGEGSGFALKPVPLKGGLDLTTPRMLVEPGKLVDVLNYECVDTDGYKKIDGFERYDGGPTTSAVGGYYLYVNASNSDQAAFETGSGIYVGANCALYYDPTGLGVAIENIPITIVSITFYDPDPPNQAYWKIVFETQNQEAVDNIIENWDGVDLLVVYDSPTSPSLFTSVAPDDPPLSLGIGQAGQVSIAISDADTTRALVQALPQDQFPYALQMYKNQMHVVADCRYIYLAYDTATSPGVTARQFYPGNTFRVGSAGTFEGVILDYRFLRGDWLNLGTTNSDRAWIKVLVYPTTPNGALVDDTTCSIDRVNNPYTSATVSCWKYQATIAAGGDPDDDESVWGGALYRGINEGDERDPDVDSWTQLDMGYEVFFESGDSDIEPSELTLATTQAQLDGGSENTSAAPENAAESFQNITYGFIDSGADWSLAGWASQSTADQVALTSGSYDLFVEEGSPDQTGVYATRSSNRWGDGTGIKFTNFGFSIPEGAIIRGIKVEAVCWSRSSTAGINTNYFSDVRLTKAGSNNKGGIAPAFLLDSVDPASPDEFSFGGESDTWGVELTPDDLNDATFGIFMNPNVQSSNLAAVQYLFWAKLKMTVYYFVPAAKAYFYDGTDHIETKLVRIALDSGSWSAGDAKGVMHVYDPVATVNRNYIKVGDALRLTSGGTSIATVTSVRASFLPSHADLVASDRRFQTIRANYFLNPDWETIYGVHGLGRAWSYDSKYFRKIYTEYDAALDKPSHIRSYRNYLALGFPSGNLLLSAISGDKGPLPEEFRSTKGAREFSFVDRIHGLRELADTSLGVFCRSSIHRLVLNPNAATPDSIFYQAVISPTSGCIEYTVDSFGDSTLYCDQYGVRTVEQTDVYGDLVAKPLSYAVSPWLRPRLSQKKYWLDSKTAQRPLFAHTIKAKNQYRVWFDDGYILCMNWNSKEEPPQFTFLRYGFDFGGYFRPLSPIAFSNDTDATVTERLHVAHWNRRHPSDDPENSTDDFKYLFELERGWSFDGQDFPTRLSVNLSLLESPYNYDSIRKAELHGLDYQNTTLFCGWGTRYSEELSYDGLAMGDTFTPAGRNAVDVVSTDYVPFSKMIQVATRGRPLLMKLKNSSTATGGMSASVIEPPHILQAVLLQYIPLRNEG